MASYWMGDRWARQQIDRRYQGVAEQLSGATFPLNQQVIDSISELTDTELLALRADGSVATSSIQLELRLPATLTRLVDPGTVLDQRVQIADRGFRFGVFPRGGPGATSDDVDRVAVLFDESSIKSARWRAAALPLITGLSTVLLLSTVALLLTGRLVRRLSRLSSQVDKIAEGDFDVPIDIGVQDEVGMLASGVQRMSQQLQKMWQSIPRTQSDKLLHQIAGGLAHQLRNSLTGARMAVELHNEKCNVSDDTMTVALAQLEQTDDYVRRLLLAAAGKQDRDHPANVATTINDVCQSLSTNAQHLRLAFDWNVDERLADHAIADAPSLSAAISNLVLNAFSVAKSTSLAATIDSAGQLRLDVTDDGPGPPSEIATELFDPFVTSKPEGLGLGLPLVARAAERLGGQVEWNRSGNKTCFTFTAKTEPTTES